MYITVTDSDLQLSGGRGGGGVLPIMTYMGRFRHFRLKGVIFFGCLGFRYEWVGKVEVEDYVKYQMHFVAVKESQIPPGLGIYS